MVSRGNSRSIDISGDIWGNSLPFPSSVRKIYICRRGSICTQSRFSPGIPFRIPYAPTCRNWIVRPFRTNSCCHTRNSFLFPPYIMIRDKLVSITMYALSRALV